jgi:hypothetical protein
MNKSVCQPLLSALQWLNTYFVSTLPRARKITFHELIWKFECIKE